MKGRSKSKLSKLKWSYLICIVTQSFISNVTGVLDLTQSIISNVTGVLDLSLDTCDFRSFLFDFIFYRNLAKLILSVEAYGKNIYEIILSYILI